MAKGLNALVIAPMGKKKEEEAEEESSDGLREAFDEFKMALDSGDDDAAFEALKNFTDMCAMKAGDY
jgi:hypothetical protein